MSLERNQLCHVLRNRCVSIRSKLKNCCAICYDRVLDDICQDLRELEKLLKEIERK